MHPEVLTPTTRRLLPILARVTAGRGFYLAGGTALALQYGHRRSVDFDFFSRRTFDTQTMRQRCARVGTFTVVGEDRGTLHGVLQGVHVTFLRYPYRLLWPLISYQALCLADPRDIACMKLQAVVSRGSKKDFFDLHELLQHYTLNNLFTWFGRKYGKTAYERLLLLKSLTYFADADVEPNPRLVHHVSWNMVKRFMRQQVKGYM